MVAPQAVRLKGRALLLCLLALSPIVAPGQEEGHSGAQSPPSLRLQDPYVGVVTDATVTFIGHEFYREFSSTWREQPRAEAFSLTIRERPSARWGSLVWVEFAHRPVFRAILSPGRRDHVRIAARDAAGVAYQTVVETEVQRLLFRDPDLAREEF